MGFIEDNNKELNDLVNQYNLSKSIIEYNCWWVSSANMHIQVEFTEYGSMLFYQNNGVVSGNKQDLLRVLDDLRIDNINHKNKISFYGFEKQKQLTFEV